MATVAMGPAVQSHSVEVWPIVASVAVAAFVAALCGCWQDELARRPPAVSLRRERRRLKHLLLPDAAVKLKAASPASRGRPRAKSILAREHIFAWLYQGERTPWDELEFEKEQAAGVRPLLVFVNSRSGGGQGVELIRELQSHLHRVQVVDLVQEGPKPALQWWSQTSQRYRVLVCGGDGTVGWVLSCLEELQPEYVPPVAILPVGTGNDLARVMGWGGGFGGGSVLPVLHKVGEAHAALLDRWAVACRDAVRGGSAVAPAPPGRERKTMVMCNYFGIGIDAAVALDFHQMRERRPHLFVSRLVNKLFYMKSGAINPFRRSCQDLASKVTLECDGRRVDIPKNVEGLVVLNIGSFGGGCDLWGWAADEDEDDEETGEDGDAETATSQLTRSLSQVRPSMQDRKLEVVGVHGTLQLGAAQVGLYSAKRLAQAHRIRITNSAALPVEVDGEPWWFANGGEVEITWRSQAFMLARKAAGSHAVATDVIDWALDQEIISVEQWNKLMKEIARRALGAGRGSGSGPDLASTGG